MLITSIAMTSADKYSLDALANLLNASFEGYAIEMRESSFDLARRLASDSVDLRRSVVATGTGAEPLGLCLVAHRDRMWRVAAMGVVPDARRQGIGRAFMDHTVGLARAAGATRLVLEVFEHNAPARALYESMGFETRRRLVGFTLDDREDDVRGVHGLAARELVEVPHLEIARALREHAPDDLPWQMQPESIAELGPPCRAFTLGGRAFVLVRELEDDVLSLRGLTVVSSARGRGIGRLFVDALRSRFPGRRWRIAPRIPEGLVDEFFLGMGFERMELVQLEMELEL